jgi:Glycosyl hydrolase family 79 C-terminal beta domain
MNRRDFIARSALAGVALAAPTTFADTSPAQVSVRIGPPLFTIASDFPGLGYEISSVARSGLLGPANSTYVELVRTLGREGVVRVGGNTADYARYMATAKPVSSPYGTMVNDRALKELGGFLEATGWKLIWALNLGSATEEDAVAEAKAVSAVAQNRLLAFEIGNEPDLFSHEKHRPPGYGYEQWLADYRRYKTALRAQLPGIPFAGPDVAGKTEWVSRFAVDEGKDIVLLTHHYYREGQNPGSTIAKLLGVDPKLQPQLDQLHAASQRCGVPYRICEVNSFSGGGRPGVSDTMASALWVLDYMFTLATNNCGGVNIETGVNQLGFISSYSPIGDDEQGHYSAKPEYYGMLAFSVAGRGELLQTEVGPTLTEIKAYATRSKDSALTITLINKGATGAILRLDTKSSSRQASVIRLEGPAVDARTEVTLGGAEITAAGAWKASKQEVLPVSSGQLSIPLAATSAAILNFL